MPLAVSHAARTIPESGLDEFGRHLLVELFDCDRLLLNDVGAIEEIVARAVIASGATAVKSLFHKFAPQGVTGVVVLAESHLSVHTWPESGYVAVDFYTCGDSDPHAGADVLFRALQAESREVLLIERGCRPDNPSMNIVEHTLAHTIEPAPAGDPKLR